MFKESDRFRDVADGYRPRQRVALRGRNPRDSGAALLPGPTSSSGPAGQQSTTRHLGLPSLSELADDSRRRVIFAFATRMAGPIVPGGLESWDLTACGEAFEPLAGDPFSFAGDFLDIGLNALLDTLLDPAGFAYEFVWVPSGGDSGFHAAIHSRM